MTLYYKLLNIVTPPRKMLQLLLMGFLVVCKDWDKIQRALITTRKRRQTSICNEWWPTDKWEWLPLFKYSFFVFFFKNGELEEMAQTALTQPAMIIDKHKVVVFLPHCHPNRQRLKYSFFPNCRGQLDFRLLLSHTRSILIAQWIFLPRTGLINCLQFFRPMWVVDTCNVLWFYSVTVH